MTDQAAATSAPTTTEERPNRRGAHLEPFTSEKAAEAGRKSGEVRRARAQAKAMERKAGAEALNALLTEYEGHNLPQTAKALALDIMRRVVTRDIPVKNGAEAAQIMRAVHEIYRLETGQSTSNSFSASVSSEDALRLLEEMRAQAGEGR